MVAAHKPEILVVDDERDILEFVVRALRRNYQVTTCGSADDARAELAKRSFVLMITDHKMPHVSGIELLQGIGQEHPEMARVLLSGYSEAPEIEAALAQGVLDAHAPKPIDGDGLHEVVAVAISRRNARAAQP
jgi:DNA-binding NtrC family response regulator